MKLINLILGVPGKLASQISFSAVMALALSCFGSAANAEQVMDEETGKPLEGVFVMVSWSSDGPGIVVSSTVCYAFETLQTDKNGMYKLPKFSWNFNPLLWERHRSVELYLAGYERSPNDFHDSDVAKMRRFKGTAQERLKKLSSIAYRESCMSDGQRKEKLAPLYKAQFEEARNIAIDHNEKEMAEALRARQIEAEFGYGAYSKMMMKEMK